MGSTPSPSYEDIAVTPVGRVGRHGYSEGKIDDHCRGAYYHLNGYLHVVEHIVETDDYS